MGAEVANGLNSGLSRIGSRTGVSNQRIRRSFVNSGAGWDSALYAAFFQRRAQGALK